MMTMMTMAVISDNYY